MPIIINEIEVLVEVTAGGQNNTSQNAAPLTGIIKDEIIKECVEKIMEIINQKNER